MGYQDFLRRIKDQRQSEPIALPDYELPTQIETAEPVKAAKSVAPKKRKTLGPLDRQLPEGAPFETYQDVKDWNPDAPIQDLKQLGSALKLRRQLHEAPKAQRRVQNQPAKAIPYSSQIPETTKQPELLEKMDFRGPSEADKMIERSTVAAGLEKPKRKSRANLYERILDDQTVQARARSPRGIQERLEGIDNGETSITLPQSVQSRLEGVDTGETKFEQSDLDKAKAAQSRKDFGRTVTKMLNPAAMFYDELAKQTGITLPQEAFENFGSTVLKTASGIPEGFVRMADRMLNTGTLAQAENIRNMINMHPEWSQEQRAEAENMIQQLHGELYSMGDVAENITNAGKTAADFLYPADPNAEESINPLKRSFYAKTMPKAAASMAPFLGAAAVGGGLGIAPEIVAGVTGAAMEVPDRYHEARDAGATPEQLARGVDVSMVAGGVESLGAGSLLGKVGLTGKSLGGHFAKEGVQEFGQEGVQSVIGGVGDKYYSQTKPDLTAGQITMEALHSAVPALFLGFGGAAMGVPHHLAEKRAGQNLPPEQLQAVAGQLQELATTQPDHPVIQTLTQIGIDPTTIGAADDRALDALSTRLQAMASMDSKIAALAEERQVAAQQVQLATDAQRMGRVPSQVDQMAIQGLPVVEQQLAEAQMEQQAIVQDLQATVSPLFKSLAKAAGIKQIEPIADIADDPKGDLLKEVRKAGGLSASPGAIEAGELERLSVKESGAGGLISRKAGEKPDTMREMMASEGLTNAETPQAFIEDVERAAIEKQKPKSELESYESYARGQMSEQELADSDNLDSLLADKTHAFTQIYRTLDNPKNISTKELRRKFVEEADKAGFSDEFIDRSLAEFQSMRGVNNAESVDRSVDDDNFVGSHQVGNAASLSPYKDIEANNKDLLKRLYDTNLNSNEGKAGIAELRKFATTRGIKQKHVDAHISDIYNWQKRYGVPPNPDVQVAESKAIEKPATMPQTAPKLQKLGFNNDQRKLLGRIPADIHDSEFDQYRQQIEELQSLAVRGAEHGGINITPGEEQGLISKLKEIRAERKRRVKAGQLPALDESRNVPKFDKKKLGQQMVEQDRARKAAEAAKNQRETESVPRETENVPQAEVFSVKATGVQFSRGEGPFIGYASGNEGGRLAVEAHGETAAEAEANAKARYEREWKERENDRASETANNRQDKKTVGKAEAAKNQRETESVLRETEDVPRKEGIEFDPESVRRRVVENWGGVEGLAFDYTSEGLRQVLGLPENAPIEPLIQSGMVEESESGQYQFNEDLRNSVKKVDIDQAAHEAATSPTNNLPEPTESQKEAGNYKKGHISLHGLDVTIENPKGSTRSGKDAKGNAWEVEMTAHYGYIRRTVGADEEQIDVYVGPGGESLDKVFIIDQVDAKTGKFDEHKVMFGVADKRSAEILYDAHFDDGKGPDRRGAIVEMSVDEFKNWLKTEDNTLPAAETVSLEEKSEKTSKQEENGDTDFQVGEYVTFSEPVVQYKSGKPFQSSKKVRGKILEIKPDGSLYLRRQDGGYTTKTRSEVSAETANVPFAETKTAKPEVDIDDLKSQLPKSVELVPLPKVGDKKTLEGGTEYTLDRVQRIGKGIEAMDFELWKSDRGWTMLTRDAESGEILDGSVVTGKPGQEDVMKRRFLKKTEEAKFGSKENAASQPKTKGEVIGSDVAQSTESALGKLGDGSDVGSVDAGNKQGETDERSIDSTGLNERESGNDGSGSVESSATDASVGNIPEKGKRPQPGSATDAGSRKRKPRSTKTAPGLFDGENQQTEPGRVESSAAIEAVEAITESLAAGEAVAQAAVANLPEVVEETVSGPSKQQLIDVNLLRPWDNGQWQYKFAPEARWMTANTEADAIEQASKAYQKHIAPVEESQPEPEPEKKPVKRPIRQPLSVLTGSSLTITPSIIEQIQSGGAVTKYRRNIEAIRTMRQVLSEGRKPTVEEQETMALYAGWGGIKDLFAASDWSHQYKDHKERQAWSERQKELKALIGDEAYTAASKSILNAHYTDPNVVRSVWEMAQRLGFQKGRVLEPSMGAGNFLGLVPAELRDKVTFTGVELDETTGSIAKLLYPDAHIQIQGFENFQAPDGFFDLAIGNVPFGDYRLSDQRYNKLLPQIHNYFFLKALDKVRPGGLVMFITSTGTMDSRRAESIRKELAKQADLVSAIRFPAETFGKTALTSVVTDLVILRKRLPGEEAGSDAWVKSTEVPDPRGTGYPKVRVNAWLAENRQNILGDFNGANRMYPGRANVDRTEDFEQRLAEAITNLPPNVMSDYVRSAKMSTAEAKVQAKNGGYVVKEGVLYQNVAGGLVDVEASGDRLKRADGLLKIRDTFNNLIDAEMGRIQGGPGIRRELNSKYDAFVSKYGPISDKKNREALEGDPDLPRLMALEDYDSKKKIAKKQAIFTKSTVAGSLANAKPENIQEAVVKSFQTRGEIIVSQIAEDLGADEQTVAEELVAKGIAYQSPQGNWELAAHYLSGKVRLKLAEARVAAATDSFFQANVDALERVMPRDISHTEISVEMGAPWMEPSLISEFVGHLFEDSPARTQVSYDANLGTYTVEVGGQARHSALASTTWGTKDVPFHELLDLALAGKSAKVMDTFKDALGGTKQVFNAEKTQAANTKLDGIKKRFREWIWEDDSRRKRLVDKYNGLFNSNVPSEYDVKFMLNERGRGVVPGLNSNWELRPHQIAAVFRAVIEKRGLLAHEVGLGKTLAMIASASELKRLGIARKPAIAVPKKVLPAFANTVRDAFPLLRLHVVDSRDAEKRQTSMSQVATGEHDLVLMTHDNLDMLKMRPDFEAEMLQKELDEVNAVYYAMKAEKGAGASSKRILKQIENRRAKLEAKINDALKSERKDDTITFEDTGIDFLFVDEFHKYKSLPVVTALGQVKGVPTGDSQRALNMLMRARYLQQIQKGGGLIAATGTPVSNSLVEAWIMSKFLQPDLLEESGVQSFDAWVRQFAETVPALEMGATGEWKTVSRLSKFRNLPELQVMSRMTLDVKTAKETGILDVRPKRQDKVIQVPQTEAQAAYMQVLRERADAIKKRAVEPWQDNYLVVSSDGMLMASDPRLVLPGYKKEGGKVRALVDNVAQILADNPNTTQMIFCDSGVSPNSWGFHLYGEITDKLVAAGIPRDKIIDFSKLNTDKKVETAVDRLNSADALIAIGHRENMGTGVNAQKRMSAIHQFDVPWKPALVEQSEARGWRQGNENKEIQILSYVTEGSFDAVKWSTVARKQQAIADFMQKPNQDAARDLEDGDDDSLSYGQIAAAASGDGDYLRKAELDARVFKLGLMEQAHNSEALVRRQEIPRIQDQIAAMNRRAEKVKKMAEVARTIKDKEFSFVSDDNRLIEDKKDAAKALVTSILVAEKRFSAGSVGYYKGLQITGGFGSPYIELPIPGAEAERVQFSLNAENFIGTIQSMERQIASLASDENYNRIVDEVIPGLERDMEKLKAVTDTPFPYTEQLAKARRQQAAVNKRLAAKETASQEEGEPLHADNTDVRAVAALGRELRRGLREKEIKPADIPGILAKRLPEIEENAKFQAEVWKEFLRKKAEDFLSDFDNDTGLAGLAITAQSANRVQASYDPEVDAPMASRRQVAGPAADLANAMDVLLHQQSILKTRGNRGARLYVNDYARALLGASLSEVSGTDYSNVASINLSRKEVGQIVDYLEVEAKALSGEYQAGALDFVDSLRQMLAASATQKTFTIVDITPYEQRKDTGLSSDRERAVETVKGDIREERFHWSQREIGDTAIASVGASWAQSSKGFGKYRKALIKLGYPDNPEILAAETAAKIAAGKFEDLDIRTDADHEQAQNWLVSYFERIADKHGLDALTKFDQLLPKAAEAKTQGAINAKDRIREAIAKEKADRERAGNGPRAPGSSGESVSSAKGTGGQSDGKDEIPRRSADEPFESVPQVKGPQLPINEKANVENVRQVSEKAPDFESVKGARVQPKLIDEGSPSDEWPTPFLKAVKQESLFDEKTMKPKKDWEWTWATLGDILNLPKALRASGDLSAGGRQGWFTSIPFSRWPIAIKSFKRGVQASEAFGFSKGAYDRLHKELTSNQAYKAMVSAGWVPLTSDEGKLTAETEMFGSRLAGALPWVKYSEQSYKMNLDWLAVSTFEIYKKGIDKTTKDLRERQEGYEAAVDWINVSLGRGSYRGKFGHWYKEKAAPFLNVIGWAPGLVYSRIQMLNPVTYAKNVKSPQHRAVFRKQMSELFQSAAVLFLTGALAKAGGALISTDPDEADFLKLRFGTTRYDVLAGLQQVARLGVKLGKFLHIKATVGDDTEAGAKELRKSGRDTTAALLRFGRTKVGPVAGLIIDWMNNWTKVTGERHAPGEFYGSFKKGQIVKGFADLAEDPLVSQVIPLFAADMVAAFEQGWRTGGKKEGLTHAAKMLPAGFGIGVQDYDRPEWSKKTAKNLDDFDLDPKFPARKYGEKETEYQARVKKNIAEKEKAIDTFVSDSNIANQPMARKKIILQQEMSEDGRERLQKLHPEDIESDRMVRTWILVGLDRMKKDPVYLAMPEYEQKKAVQSYYGRMSKYKAQPANKQHGYQAPDVVTENTLRKKIKEAIESREGN